MPSPPTQWSCSWQRPVQQDWLRQQEVASFRGQSWASLQLLCWRRMERVFLSLWASSAWRSSQPWWCHGDGVLRSQHPNKAHRQKDSSGEPFFGSVESLFSRFQSSAPTTGWGLCLSKRSRWKRWRSHTSYRVAAVHHRPPGTYKLATCGAISTMLLRFPGRSKHSMRQGKTP